MPSLIAILTIVVAFILSNVFKFLIRYYEEKKPNSLSAKVLDSVEEPIVYLIVLLGLYWAVNDLTNAGAFILWLSRIFYFLFIMGFAWLLIRIISLAIDFFMTRHFKDQDEGRRLLVISRLAQQILSSFLWVMAIVMGLDNAGIDVSALIAGMGISGLALSLAAKDFAANLFGGFSVFFDQLFKLGDTIKVKGFEGKVNYVGPRITQIITSKNEKVMIPNSSFSSNPVVVLSQQVPAQFTALQLLIGLSKSTAISRVHESLVGLEQCLGAQMTEENRLKIHMGEQRPAYIVLQISFLLSTNVEKAVFMDELQLKLIQYLQDEQVEYDFLT